MNIKRYIAVLLSLNILFSNMLWAMDECGLTLELSSPSFISIQASSINDVFDNTADNSVDKNCNQFCIGWTHLNYLSYSSVINEVRKNHADVMSYSHVYHSLYQKPPTEPPRA